MRVDKSQKKNYFWNTLGVLLQNALSPILLLVVTRINGIFDSGLFSFAFAVALIFWAIGMWGGRTFQVSDLRREFSEHSYVTVRIVLGIGMTIVATLFCIVNHYSVLLSSTLITLVVFKAIESIADSVYGILQVKGRLYIAGISLTLKMIVGTIAFILIDFSTRNIFLSSLGVAIVNVAIFLTYDLYQTRAVGYFITHIFRAHREHIQKAVKIMRTCAPIAIVVFLSMFSLNIPRYFLSIYHQSQLGYFGILAMPITVLGLLITFLLQPKIIHMTESFTAKNFKAFNGVVRTMSLSIVAAGILGLILSYFIGVPLLRLVFGVPFSAQKTALMIIVVGSIANGFVSLYMNIFIIIRHFKVLFYTLLITNCVLAIVSIPIVAEYGLVGSVVLFTAISFVQLIVLSFSYKKYVAQ